MAKFEAPGIKEQVYRTVGISGKFRGNISICLAGEQDLALKQLVPYKSCYSYKTIWKVRRSQSLKCHHDQYPFFAFSYKIRFSLTLNPNFNLLRTFERFWTFISVNLRSPLIFLVPSLVWQFEWMTVIIFSNIYFVNATRSTPYTAQ